jgi:transposase
MENARPNTDVAAANVRLRVPDRTQVVMKVESPDELIAADHPARLVWRVVEAMDFSGFLAPIKARDGVCGRDRTDPRLLAALWLYATIRGVGSARELARLCLESRPYLWICGGVSVNHHLLSDFRVDYAEALDALFTRSIATLVDQGLVTVTRISQDGTRVRACAGAASFRRKDRLSELLEKARRHVAEVKALLDDPARSAGLSAKKKAARKRAAKERQERVEQAIAALPELEKEQEKLARKVARKDKARKLTERRASTTDAQARVMKMANGGFNPAVNMQFAVDTQSRAIVGVAVVDQGTDNHLAEPMRQQVEERTGGGGRKVKEHLVDGGYLVKEEVERAAAEGVTLFVPPKPPRNKAKRGNEYEPMPDESPTLTDWRRRMGSDAGQTIYKERAATSETVNADLKSHRGLDRLRVRGLKKAKCVALWLALAYNVMHFATALIG